MLEAVFEYREEETNNPIVDIMVDTLVQNRLDIYVMHYNQ